MHAGRTTVEAREIWIRLVSIGWIVRRAIRCIPVIARPARLLSAASNLKTRCEGMEAVSSAVFGSVSAEMVVLGKRPIP